MKVLTHPRSRVAVEVDEALWVEFREAEDRYEGLLARLAEMAEEQRKAAEAELEAARARVAALEARLGKPKPAPPPQAGGDETDASMGVGEDSLFDGGTSASDFVAELSSLRARNVEKRRKRGLNA